MEPQNKNNNAYTAAVSQKSSSAKSEQFEQIKKPLENKSTGVKMEEKTTETNLKQMSNADMKIVKKEKQILATTSNGNVQKNSKTTELDTDLLKSNSQSSQKLTGNLSPVAQISLPAENNKEIQRASRNNSSFTTSQGKITQNVPSRFGMKTFTVVPPKPFNIQAAATQPARTLSTGAIKIDDQGNMVTVGISHNKSSQSSKSVNEGALLCEKAKIFWSFNEKEENAVIHRTTLVDKTKDNISGLSDTPTVEKKTMQSAVTEPAKTVQPTVVKEENKEFRKVVTLANKKGVEVDSRSSASGYVQLPSKPALPPPLPADSKQQQLTFLKPSRRTSSKYVASAISKYTPKTSVQPSSIPKFPDSNKSLETQTVAGVQRSGPFTQETPSLPGPKSSIISPEYVSNCQRDLEKGKLDKEGLSDHTTFIKEGSDVWNTKTVKNNSNGFLQNRGTDNIREEYVKPDQTRTPSPLTSTALHSSLKPPIAPKITFQKHIDVSKT